MSDTPQGPGWWQASDGKWYAPEQAPGYQSPASGQPAMAGGGGNMTMGTPDIGSAISYGWTKFLANIGPILIILLVIVAVQVVFNVVGFGLDSFLLRQLLSAIGWVVSMILYLGLVRAGLAIVRGETPDAAILFKTQGLGPYIIASILIGIGFTLGLILCIIPGLLVLFFTWFYGFFIVDKNLGPTDAITASYNMVKENASTLILFLLVSMVLSFCTCGLAAGVIWIATAYMFKTLNGEPVAV